MQTIKFDTRVSRALNPQYTSNRVQASETIGEVTQFVSEYARCAAFGLATMRPRVDFDDAAVTLADAGQDRTASRYYF